MGEKKIGDQKTGSTFLHWKDTWMSLGWPLGPGHRIVCTPQGSESWLRARLPSPAAHRVGENTLEKWVAGSRPVAVSLTEQTPRQERNGMEWRCRLNKLSKHTGKAKCGQGDQSQTLLLPAFPVPPPITEVERFSSWVCLAVLTL